MEGRSPKPYWIRAKLPSGQVYQRTLQTISELGLSTVCREANCPNIGDCWSAGTVTFMIMGDTCTRACRFCAVKKGNPHGVLDPYEPAKIAEAVRRLGINYVVLTSVDRDDLEDGGAQHFAKTIRSLHAIKMPIIIEALIPDFGGSLESLRVVVNAEPDVIGHNLETVERLTPKVRDRRAGYRQSLEVLRSIKVLNKRILTKSSLMLGLGETENEVLQAMSDLREAGVDFLTLGQYLQPSKNQLEVAEYVRPEKFDHLRKKGEAMGFKYVASGPLVRSSYRAGELFLSKILHKDSVI